jgi:hypothetical protein
MKDSMEYISQFGTPKTTDEIIRFNCKKHKIILDNFDITKDNVGEISDYALMSYIAKRYDEVYVEYRTKKLLRR